MAQKDSSHSSTQRTVLWIIIPATVATSLMFTWMNHRMAPPKEELQSDFTQQKKEMKVDTSHGHAHDTIQVTTDSSAVLKLQEIHEDAAKEPAAPGHH